MRIWIKEKQDKVSVACIAMSYVILVMCNIIQCNSTTEVNQNSIIFYPVQLSETTLFSEAYSESRSQRPNIHKSIYWQVTKGVLFCPTSSLFHVPYNRSWRQHWSRKRKLNDTSIVNLLQLLKHLGRPMQHPAAEHTHEELFSAWDKSTDWRKRRKEAIIWIHKITDKDLINGLNILI